MLGKLRSLIAKALGIKADNKALLAEKKEAEDLIDEALKKFEEL